ncbi:uncharacterized protein EV422DRAFT_65447 [Fimicolochytrium jonesii]|uniref:uncharacterized protein n=1 Tax=Fimicolochytrium jonesii TaxID=1396493 RepID=UPI0022FEE4EA|nr:uncharacterized protein EV422DRAFT_65447 [Fimicolochytrium jonesii]KAI8820829.1 hypothetical protein EV422DRAFT_65447 [Fimicolochytrium jonesii]
MEKYRRTSVGQDPVAAPLAPNEIRISQGGKINKLVENIIKLHKEGKHTTIIITGKGNAVNKAVTVAEIAKRKLGGDKSVSQHTDIYNEEVTDVWDPIEGDLDRLLVIRHTPCIKMTFTMVNAMS